MFTIKSLEILISSRTKRKERLYFTLHLGVQWEEHWKTATICRKKQGSPESCPKGGRRAHGTSGSGPGRQTGQQRGPCQCPVLCIWIPCFLWNSLHSFWPHADLEHGHGVYPDSILSMLVSWFSWLDSEPNISRMFITFFRFLHLLPSWSFYNSLLLFPIYNLFT
jgi:hypothetical protein